MAAGSLGEAILRITANTAQFMKQTQGVLGNLNSMAKSAKAVADGMAAAGRQAALFGTAILAALAPAIIEGGKFEQAMANVKAVMSELHGETGLAVAKFEQLNEKAKELGATTVFTATQVAEAMHFMGLTGFSTREVLQGVEGVLNLAAAGMMGLARATDLATDVQVAFGLGAESLSRVADVMAQTATNANTTIELLGTSMQLVSPVAAALGQSVEQTATAIGLLGNAGLKGTVAGAGFAQVLGQLVKKGDNANKVLRKYGLTIKDVSPEFVTIREMISKFEQVNLSAGDAMTLFGARAGRMILALTGQGAEAFDALNEKLERAAGAAKLMADIQLDTFIGDFTILKSALAGLGVEIFESISSSLREMTQWATKAITAIKDWVVANEETTAIIIKVVAAIGAFLVAGGSLLAIVGTAAGMFLGFVIVMTKVIAILSGVSLAAVGIAAAIGAVLIPVVVLLIRQWEKLSQIATDAWNNYIKPALIEFGQTMQQVWNDWLKPAFEQVEAAFAELLDAVGEFLKAFGPGLTGQIKLAEVGFIVLAAAITAAAHAIALFIRLSAAMLSPLAAVINAIKGTEEADKNAAAAAERAKVARERANMAAQASAQGLKEYLRASEKASAEDLKSIDLQERLSSLDPVSRKTLAEGFAEGKGEITSMRARRDELQAQIDRAKKDLAKGGTDSANTKLLEDQIKAGEEKLKNDTEMIAREEQLNRIRIGGAATLKSELEMTQTLKKSAQERLQQLSDQYDVARALGQNTEELSEKLLKENETVEQLTETEGKLLSLREQDIALLAELGGSYDSFAESKLKDLETTKKMLEAEKDLASIKGAMSELSKTLYSKQLEGLAKEREGVRELERSQKDLLNQRRAALLAIREGLEVRKRDAEATTDATHRAEQLSRVQAELGQNAAALANNRDMLAKSTENAAKAEEDLLKAAAESRKNFVRDLEIEDLKRQGRSVEAARLTNQKILEEEKKLNDQKFQLDGKNDEQIKAQRAKAEELQRKAASARLADAFKEQDGEAESKLSNVAEKELDLEKSITSQLAQQVRSVRDMYMLYVAIAQIRHIQETRARQAADAVLMQEHKIAKMQERRAKMGDNEPGRQERMDLALARQRQQLALSRQIAGKRGQEAQLGQPADVAAEADAAALKAKMDAMALQIAGLRDKIAQMTLQGKELFGNAPTQWADAFIANWAVAGQRMVEAVQTTMHDIGTAMQPTTRNSPSLIDIWKMNAKAAGEGVKSIQESVNRNMPNLSALNASQAIAQPNRGIPASGMKRQAQSRIDQFNDNRRVQMDIHSSLDVEEMKRQLGLALEPAAMGRAGEI